MALARVVVEVIGMEETEEMGMMSDMVLESLGSDTKSKLRERERSEIKEGENRKMLLFW